MKTTLLTLLLFILGIASSQHASAQMPYGLKIHFYDLNQQPYTDSIPVLLVNTDSNNANPYTSNTGGGTYQGSTHKDSGFISSSYADSLISIHYFVCGQWLKIDTIFPSIHHPGVNGRWLSIGLQVPCYVQCNAGFSMSYPNDSISINRSYYANYSTANLQHFWNFGDGHTATGSQVYHQHTAIGNYTVTHIVWDSTRNCTDTSTAVIYVRQNCNAAFAITSMQNGKFNFAPSNILPNYTHIWKMGDGSVYTNDSAFKHHYRISSPYEIPITHIVESAGQCKDSIIKTIKHLQGTTSIASNALNFKTLTIQPSNNIDTFVYAFGDGDTIIDAGIIHHIYAQAGSYTVTVQDLHSFHNPLSLNIWVFNNCASNFSVNIDSLFRIKITVSNLNNNVRHIIGNDTLYGSPAYYVFNTGGMQTVYHEVLDSIGNAICQAISYPYFSTCGYDYSNHWSDTLWGTVLFNNSNTTAFGSLKVYLIEHDQTANTLTAIDSATLIDSISQGDFYFMNLCDTSKQYLVKAALLPSSSIYSNFLPTYGNQSSSWSGANSYPVGTGVYIDMISGTNPGGPGFIGGLISQGANKKFKPLDGVQVNLFDDANNPVAYTMSKDGGKYEFPNLAYGNYVVVVEELGKTSASYSVTLDPNNQKFETGNFEVNSTYVSLLSTGIQKQELSSGLYPNPCFDVLIIDWIDENGDQVEVSFYGLDGKLLQTIQLKKEGKATQIDVSELPKGLYYLRIIGEKGQSSHLIQKL